MKARDLREQTDEELAQSLAETREEYNGMKVKGPLGEAGANPVKARLLRRQTARIKTVLRERELKSHG